MGRWLRVYVPGVDWLVRRWGEYLETAAHRRRRIEAEEAAARFEDWLEERYRAGDDLTEALRLAPMGMKCDFLRARRLDVVPAGLPISERYITAFGEIDVHRVFA